MWIEVWPSHTTNVEPISAARAAVEAPIYALHQPLPTPKTVLSSWSLVVICPLIARGKFKPELEFQTGTSSQHASYMYQYIGYVEVAEDHLFATYWYVPRISTRSYFSTWHQVLYCCCCCCCAHLFIWRWWFFVLVVYTIRVVGTKVPGTSCILHYCTSSW